jgi:hypothetical protein
MNDDTDELARWREMFELRDGVAYRRADPKRGASWNTAWAGKPLGDHVMVGGRKLSAARVIKALKTGIVPSALGHQFKAKEWDVSHLPEEVRERIGKGPLAAALNDAVAETGLSRKALIVLTKDRDPFALDNDGGHVEGYWFKTQFDNLVGARRLHLRGIHYLLSSTATIRKPDGTLYVNTFADWSWLVNRAAKCARWLGYVPFNAIDDSRNEARHYRIRTRPAPVLSAGSGILGADSLPTFGPPRAWLLGFDTRQKFAFALFGEKSSLADVLDQAAQRFGADLYIGAGELSDTMIEDLAQRAVNDGRVLVCLTCTDFDPSGRQMVTSIARKLRGLKLLKFATLEYRIRAIALTLEQATERWTDDDGVIHDGLPSTPLKDTDKRKGKWLARFGREQTEIDALMALRPGALEAAVEAAFAPYFDDSLADRVCDIRVAWEADAQARLDAHVGADQVEDWRARFDAARAEIEAVHAEQNEAARGFRARAPALPEPDLDSEPVNGDIGSSAMTFADESLALKARKAFTDEDDEDDEEEDEQEEADE